MITLNLQCSTPGCRRAKMVQGVTIEECQKAANILGFVTTTDGSRVYCPVCFRAAVDQLSDLLTEAESRFAGEPD